MIPQTTFVLTFRPHIISELGGVIRTEFSKKKLLENKEMDFKNGVKNIQAAGYNGLCTVNVSMHYRGSPIYVVFTTAIFGLCFSISRGPPTVPLMRILHNACFFSSPKICVSAGTLCKQYLVTSN